ncbi:MULTISPECIES: hypothetical protein [unclassified Streptomyces]|uniref:hypothetical protein n=1 Tax=unclassified Streptomyces TaxID=2593676 RepID=UPI0033314073
MNTDHPRELIPRDKALRLISELKAIKGKAHNAAQQWELLEETGNVPATASYTGLLQHAIDSQDLSHEVLRLTANFARSPYRNTPAGSCVPIHLGIAATMSNHATAQFAETAECGLALLQSADPAGQEYLTTNMVSHHATGRAYLRRTAQALSLATGDLVGHLGFQQRTLATPTLQENPPAPAPPGPGGPHR